MPREPKALRKAREERAVWSVLSLKLWEARGAVSAVVRHCAENDLPAGEMKNALSCIDSRRAIALEQIASLDSFIDSAVKEASP